MNTTFTLDTSGRVSCTDPTKPCICHAATWDRLDPFTQGYVAALLRDFSANLLQPGEVGPTGVEFGFSDLAPETLAQIMDDCKDAASILRRNHLADDGRWFWNDGKHRPGFPPLTPYLGDDGKVYLSEAA